MYYVYIFIFDPKLHKYSRTLPGRFTWAAWQTYLSVMFLCLLFFYSLCSLYLRSSETRFFFLFGAWSLTCHATSLSEVMVGNIFMQRLQLICSLLIWFSKLILLTSFSLQSSHLYVVVPFFIWNFLSWFERFGSDLNTLSQSLHFCSFLDSSSKISFCVFSLLTFNLKALLWQVLNGF